MRELSSFQVVELFQLAFCREIFKEVKGRAFALKGGGCLRFFHGSLRLSEDIDFDVGRIRQDTLENNVNNAFQSPRFQDLLRSLGIIEINRTYLKAGKATQRWKCGLVRDSGEEVHTKLEFSRRRKPEDIQYEKNAIKNCVLDKYELEPFNGQYYNKESMLIQKIRALADPDRWAVRDGYDIHFLLEQGTTIPGDIESDLLEAVMETMETITWKKFQGEVLPYLEAEAYERFRKKEAYEALLDRLETEFLKQMNSGSAQFEDKNGER